MKPFMMTLALDGGVVEPGDVIDCEKGRYRIGRNTIHDTHEYGDLSIEEIIQLSSNIGSAKVAERLGAERLYDGLARCGFGRKTGIDLTGESGGLFRDWHNWRRIGLATHAFGQGMSVTGIQLATALSTVANGGALMQPRVILDVTDRDGHVVDIREPEVVDHPFGPEAAAQMRQMLGLVVQEGGTGTRARLDHYSCGGKTGTAQKVKPDTGRYDRSLWVSSFIGFAPLENPRIVVVVVVDEPHGKHYGGTVAGPVFKEIATRTLKTLGVPPLVDAIAELPIDSSPLPQEAEAPEVVLSVDDGTRAPLDMVAGELIDELDGQAAMPDLDGLTLRSALRRLGGQPVEIRVEGSGYLVEQIPSPGVPLRGGDEVVLSFAERQRP
jgi:cell division protein FtsI (penicillin-binding protein 3)